MARRSGGKKWMEPFLEPDDELQAIVPAQSGLHPFTMLLPAFALVGIAAFSSGAPIVQVMAVSTSVTLIVATLYTSGYRVLGFVADAVLVCRARAWRPSRPVELLERLPHGDRFEPSGTFWAQVQVGDERLWVHKRFFQTLAEIDRRQAPSRPSPHRAKKRVRNAPRRRGER